MSDSRDDDVDELSRGSRTSSELLDLVRDAEDDARIPTRQAPPSSTAEIVEADELLADEGERSTERARADDGSADFVEVGDDAIDEPPSRPRPDRSDAPIATTPRTAPPPDIPPAGVTSPIVAIALLFVLAGAALAVLAR